MEQPSQQQKASSGHRWSLASYRAASFLSAFLLFLIQPMASKALLPAFGGSFLVWGACMVFFQASLLVGYTYAHVAQSRMGVKRYGRLHLLFLLAPCLAFPFDLANAGVALDRFPLVVGVVVGLVRSVGWPFLALSTSSLILQRWLSQSELPERSNPYTLYAWSNFGSILGLLAYPFALEPLLPLLTQEYVWWAGYALLIGLHVVCIPSVTSERTATPAGHKRVSARDTLRWIALSASACAALLAVTNVMTFDIASVPFLWVLPLCVYLACFVLTFKQRLWCPTWIRPLLVWLAIFATILRLLAGLRLSAPIWLTVPFNLALLFCLCLECSAGLIRTKPRDNDQLTTFYLVIAAGGLLGSLLVSWFIPLVSTSIVEYGLAIAGGVMAISFVPTTTQNGHGRAAGWIHVAGGAAIIALALTIVPWATRQIVPAAISANIALAACALPVALSLRYFARSPRALALLLAIAAIAMQRTEPLFVGASEMHRHRNYYGIYKVYVQDGMRYLQHGTTQHGRQYLAGPKRDMALAYYHPTTPGAQILTAPATSPRRVGMIGLGAGSFAAYLGAGQSLKVFELDPDNLPLARDYFGYLDSAEQRGAEISFRFGDGRVSLRDEEDGSLDILIVDAFNSGSIPVHLLTAEAMEEYRRVITPEGIILLHVSNKVLDLMPVVYDTARAINLNACEKSLLAPETPDADSTWWMALTPSEGRLKYLREELGWHQRSQPATPGHPWTDQYCNVLKALF